MSDQTNTSRDESRYGSGASSIARTTLKMAVLAPMPSASVATAAAVNPGARRRPRMAQRTSAAAASIVWPARTPRTSSFTRIRLPASRRASARAASEFMPAAIFFSATSSTYARSSSSRSRSSAEGRTRVRHNATRRARSRMSGLAEHLGDGERDARPLFLLGGEAAAPGGGQRIALDPAPLLVGGPVAGDQPVRFEPVERRKERSRLHAEGAARDLLQAFGDAEAVPRLELERAEDQEVERAFEKLGARHGRRRYRYSISSSDVNSPAREVLLVVRAAGARVHRVLRIRAQRARARRLVVFQLACADPLGRFLPVDPRVDRRRPVDAIRARTAGAVQHAGHQEQARVVVCARVARLHVLVVLHGRERRQARVGPAVPQNQLVPLRLERAQVGIVGVEDRADVLAVARRARHVVLRVVPRRIAEDEVLEELRAEGVAQARALRQLRRSAGNPGGPSGRLRLAG